MISRNALNPIWEETFEIEVHLPELAFARFTVSLIGLPCSDVLHEFALHTGLVKRIWSKVALKHWIVIAQAVSCCLLP